MMETVIYAGSLYMGLQEKRMHVEMIASIDSTSKKERTSLVKHAHAILSGSSDVNLTLTAPLSTLVDTFIEGLSINGKLDINYKPEVSRFKDELMEMMKRLDAIEYFERS